VVSRVTVLQSTKPISVQAHFEAVLISVIGAEEKIKEAIKIRYGATTEPESEKAYRRVASAVSSLTAWHKNPLGQDIRLVRNLAVHEHYEKVQQGDCWIVQSVDSVYRGSRELREYCKAAVCYVKELVDVIPEIESSLRR
jgi:hypothetical protein